MGPTTIHSRDMVRERSRYPQRLEYRANSPLSPIGARLDLHRGTSARRGAKGGRRGSDGVVGLPAVGARARRGAGAVGCIFLGHGGPAIRGYESAIGFDNDGSNRIHNGRQAFLAVIEEVVGFVRWRIGMLSDDCVEGERDKRQMERDPSESDIDWSCMGPCFSGGRGG